MITPAVRHCFGQTNGRWGEREAGRHRRLVPLKNNQAHLRGLDCLRVPDDDLLSHGQSALSSARRRFTVLFGMGRGGASGLSSSGIDLGVGQGESSSRLGQRERKKQSWVRSYCAHTVTLALSTHRYGIKPHGQLVSVSSRRYRPSTPDLSTWWSATTLQGDQVPGRSHLQARFPLRCFQRLSLPYIATRQCDWRHNRYTSGTSTPVLSY